MTGTLPVGLSWDPWWRELTGVPEESGTFPMTLTAHGDYGTATKTYDIIVGSPQNEARYPVGRAWVHDEVDGLGTSARVYLSGEGYFRLDNPAFATTFPVIGDLQRDGYIYSVVDGASFYDSEGQPLPIAGQVTLELAAGSPDWFTIQGTVHRTDQSSDLISELLDGGGRVTFTHQGGLQNTVEFVMAN